MYKALSQGDYGDQALRGVLHRIRRETEQRGAYFDAALLRARIHHSQSLR
jgi:hypothetical protein